MVIAHAAACAIDLGIYLLLRTLRGAHCVRLCDVRGGALTEPETGTARECPSAKHAVAATTKELVISRITPTPKVYFFFSAASSFIFFRMPAMRFSVHVARWAS